jgi:2-dehydropantoate 2-reductase
MTCHVMVLGAGSIGTFVGGKLAAAGANITFVGRRRVLDEIVASGLRLTDLDGGEDEVAGDRFAVATEPDDVGSADLVLVAVKSAATSSAVRELTSKIRPGTVVVSLQNGIGNDAVIRDVLPTCVVLAGMVMFNVVHHTDGRFHRGTEGGIAVQDNPALEPFAEVFEQAGLPLRRYPDVLPVQWAKLLLNLNNPINALSGRPLREVLAIDPVARSSMADDLALGRKTEISWLCGEIVSLGTMAGIPTPVNQRLIELIVAAEQGDRRIWTGQELLEQLRAAAAEGRG